MSKREGLSLDDDGEVALVARDGSRHTISRKAAALSDVLRSSLETDREAKEMEFKQIDGDIMAKAVQYLTYHQDNPPRSIPKPLVTSLNDEVDSFDASFSDTDQDTLFKLILVANYLSIKPLLHLMCARVASLMKGKTPEQIRATFNIRNDATPTEEEEIRREYKDIIG